MYLPMKQNGICMWKTRVKRAEQLFEKILQYEREEEKIKWKQSQIIIRESASKSNLLKPFYLEFLEVKRYCIYKSNNRELKNWKV